MKEYKNNKTSFDKYGFLLAMKFLPHVIERVFPKYSN